MAATDIFHITGGLVPARRAIRCIGGNVDDYIQVNAAGVSHAGGEATGSIGAWINVPDITGTYCIICFGDDNVVEFLEVNVEAGKIVCRCTDATTAQFVSTTDAVVIKPHQWVHVVVVQDGLGQGVKIYINGARVASTNSTATDVLSWWHELDGLDTCRIGAANKAGDASVTNEFKGAISDVKIWDETILSPDDVEKEFGGTNVYSLTDVVANWWKFDDDLVDAGFNADNGTNTGGGIVLCPAYSEFSSRISFQSSLTMPVVADVVLLSCTDKTGHAVIIKAA